MSKRQHITSDQYLRRIPIFSSLNEESFEKIRQLIVEKFFSRNQIILYEDESTEHFYIISFGKVKVIQIDHDGLEHIVAVHKKGDFFGEMGILDGKTAPARVVAVEDTGILFLKKEHFIKHFFANTESMSALILVLCHRLRDAWFKIRIVRIADANRRIRAVLHHMGMNFGIMNSRGILINMKLTHNDIASYASLTRETVSRHIKKLERCGEIEFTGDRYIILKPTFIKVDFM